MRLRNLLVLIVLPAALVTACAPDPEPPQATRLGAALGGEPDAGYARAITPREFHFPADHGAHPEFRNEWWYLTGNLATQDGRRFGYQFTLFRIALSPDMPPRDSAWASRQVWMGHAAVTDIGNRRHRSDERFARGALGLAGAEAAPLRIWLEDWQLSAPGDGRSWQVEFASEDFALQLDLDPIKPPVLQGDRGLSQKSASPGNASYYYSLPRLVSSGRLTLGGETLPVTGLSWLDREWSTSALGPDQAGWDWFAIQLEDGRDLMYYQLRRNDGSADPHSGGSLSGADGSLRRLRVDDVALTATEWWTSPEGSRYPIGWDLALAPTGERWRIQAAVEDQLMAMTVRYWEGAIEVVDAATGALLGRGYLELAGY